MATCLPPIAKTARAEQELKAIRRVTSVRHAYILSIERLDIIDGQLIIVTELADRTLWDRFRECQKDGWPGIPREELLAYMEETAEALDFMNEQYQLQHLDIKPQNLFLVHNHIKVADFGLAKDMGDKAAATITGGVTPVYAAPETFDGWLSHFSDQYSLAIVYQEILTGIRPFTGSTMRQLVLQHLQMAPDLSSLPVADRPIIGRALNKNHEERFPSCHELVRRLRAATGSSGAPPLPTPAAVKPAPAPVNSPEPSANDAGDDSQVTHGAARTEAGQARRHLRNAGEDAQPREPAPGTAAAARDSESKSGGLLRECRGDGRDNPDGRPWSPDRHADWGASTRQGTRAWQGHLAAGAGAGPGEPWHQHTAPVA